MKSIVIAFASLVTMFVGADIHYNEKCEKCGEWSSRGVTYSRGAGYDIWGFYYRSGSAYRITGIKPCPFCHAEFEGDSNYKRAYETAKTSSTTTSSGNTDGQSKHYYVIAYDIVARSNINQVLSEGEFKGEYTDFNSAWDALLNKYRGSVIVLRATWILK